MAVPAALIPPAPLVPPPPISAPSATTSPPSATSSPSPSLVPNPSGPGQQNLFRSELLAAGGSPGIPNAGLPPGKPVYSTPSPVENIPQNNECKMVELRGAKVASFTVDGCELICLPQAFDLFLKHLVGGLHTVYTKLKRLEITPVVCNVEQVRILRGLGAIQPGVNRCKLISRKDFETLYNDCTNARLVWRGSGACFFFWVRASWRRAVRKGAGARKRGETLFLGENERLKRCDRLIMCRYSA